MDTLQKQLKRNPFKNQDGKVVLMQFPNWQLWGVIVITLAQKVIPGGDVNGFLKAAHFMLIVFWAYEELIRGDNLFRRALGALVLITTFLALAQTVN